MTSARAREDGTLTPMSLTISPIRHASGDVVGVSTIARDITERKRAQEVAFPLPPSWSRRTTPT